jgi:hypothetical protein
VGDAHHDGTHNMCAGSQDLLEQAPWADGSILDVWGKVRRFLAPLSAKKLVQIVYDTHNETSSQS